jgi:hypothetical protein
MDWNSELEIECLGFANWRSGMAGHVVSQSGISLVTCAMLCTGARWSFGNLSYFWQ